MRKIHPIAVLLVFLWLGAAAFAARNSGGTYSLPAGNPVVSGTTITSTWANTTLNDIKTEMTNSLDRQGRGGMLAPLQLVAGTVGAPGLTFSLEPGSGAYRASAGDWRLTTLGTAVLKLQSALVTTLVPLTVTGRTTTTDLTVTGTSAKLTVVSASGTGLTSTGEGTGNGVSAFGGATSGAGVTAVGGAPNGMGIQAAGTGTGRGVYGVGGSSSGIGVEGVTLGGNGIGVKGTGIGSGSGGNFYTAVGASATNGTAALNGIGQGTNTLGVWGVGTGTYEGVRGVGGATGVGVQASAGTAATSSARTDAIYAVNGDISLDGVTSPNSDVVITNRITPKNIPKAWGAFTLGAAGAVSIVDGFNVASVATGGSACGGTTNIVVTFASNFASSTSFVVVPGQVGNSLCSPRVISKTSSTVTIGLLQPRFDAVTPAFGLVNCQQVACGAGSSATFDWNGAQFTILAVGAQ